MLNFGIKAKEDGLEPTRNLSPDSPGYKLMLKVTFFKIITRIWCLSVFDPMISFRKEIALNHPLTFVMLP